MYYLVEDWETLLCLCMEVKTWVKQSICRRDSGWYISKGESCESARPKYVMCNVKETV